MISNNISEETVAIKQNDSDSRRASTVDVVLSICILYFVADLDVPHEWW
jgi:hypothetical protein